MWIGGALGVANVEVALGGGDKNKKPKKQNPKKEKSKQFK